MPKDKRKLLILAPGYGDPNFIIDQVAKNFEGEFNQLVLSYPDRGMFRPIEDIAVHFYHIVEHLISSYDFVAFVGHSMGGLVGRQLNAIHYERHERHLFDAYVSVGTPHKGTTIAQWLPEVFHSYLAPVTQMAPGSAFLTALEASEATYKEPLASMSIQAAFDPLVWPQASAIYNPHNHITIPGTEHITVATSKRTVGEIWCYLTYEMLDSTGEEFKPGFRSNLR